MTHTLRLDHFVPNGEADKVSNGMKIELVHYDAPVGFYGVDADA